MQNKQEIDSLFTPPETDENGKVALKHDEVLQAHIDIVALQKNEKRGLKTGLEHTDYNLIDGLTNKMVFYGSRPSMGKTYLCDQIIDSLNDKELNPMPVETLRLNWEMITKMLLLRKLKIKLGKSMREIITTEYTAEEQVIVKQVVASMRRKDLLNFSKIVEGEEFKYLIRAFYNSGNTEAEKVVLVDHLHILTKKDRIDSFLYICNELKLEFPKLSFIFFFQLNRELEKVWKGTRDNKPNPKNFRPHSGDIYNTDNLMQYADLICTLIIPQAVNLEEYAAVHRYSYEHLKEHFVEDGLDSDWARLEGRNRIYYEYIKNRMVDDFDDPKLFCSILDDKKEVDLKRTPVNTISGPVFDKKKEKLEYTPNAPLNLNMEVAFGPSEDFSSEDENKDDLPF